MRKIFGPAMAFVFAGCGGEPAPPGSSETVADPANAPYVLATGARQ